MGATTGPVLAAGAVTIANQAIVNDQFTWFGAPSGSGDPRMLRIIVATAIAAGGLRLWEEFMPRTANAVAWLTLLTVLLVRVDPDNPSPMENLADWYNNGGRK